MSDINPVNDDQLLARNIGINWIRLANYEGKLRALHFTTCGYSNGKVCAPKGKKKGINHEFKTVDPSMAKCEQQWHDIM